jgi:hypothetical protein
MGLVITILGIALGAMGHLMLLVLCLAGMPNSSEKQLAQIRLWMLGIMAVGLAVAGIGIWLHRTGHPGWAAAINLASPVVLTVVLLKVSTP